MLHMFGMVHCNSTKVPMAKGVRLIVDMNEEKVDATTYRKMVGKLIYLVNTKPNLSFSMSVMSRFLAKPQQPHFNAVKQILRYLKDIIDCGILYRRGHNANLEACVDFDWENDLESRRITNGYFLKIGNFPMSLYGKIQVVVALFLVEAEYCALMEGTKKVVWLRKFLSEINYITP